MALILENVGKTFENTGRATLKNINLEIQPGEFKRKRSKRPGFRTDSDVSGTCSVSVAECYPKYKVWNENKWSSEGRTGNTGRKIFEDDAVRTI